MIFLFMKKHLLLVFFFLLSVTAVNADDPADGFYRVHNLKTGRYVYVTDNTGKINEYRDYPDKDVLIKEIQNHVKKVSAPYKYPRVIEFVDELPKTISGKIRRVEIRDRDASK